MQSRVKDLVTVLQLAMIYGIFCIGLNFFMGYTGQASFGQNAFAAIGGYGTAILCVQYHWEPILALLPQDESTTESGGVQ